MKNLVLTFWIICVGLSSAQISQLEPVEKENKHFFVGIVVDSSPTNETVWSIRKSRAIELISNLEQGDKVLVLKARPGSPAVYGKTIIGGPQKTGSNEIVAQVSVLKKELLSSADVARACESIYDIFVSEGNHYKCLLVVLTSGKVNNNQAQRIIGTSSQIRTLGGFICLTYDPAVANQNIITAGKKNDFDVLLESNPDLASWIESKRDVNEPEKIVIENTKYVFVEPNLTPMTTMIDKAMTSLKSNVNVAAPSIVPQVPQVQDADAVEKIMVYEPNDIPESGEADLNTPAEVDVVPEDTNQMASPKAWSLSPWIIIFLVAVMLIAVALLVIAHHKQAKTSDNEQDSTNAQPSNLKAIIGEQDIDLGDIDLISELTLGSDPGCGIFIDDDQVSPQQARIFRTRKYFKLQNLAPEPLFVNGQEVKNKKKVALEFPADVQLPNGTILNLYTDNLGEIKDKNNE
jgi:hypothetical protein